VGGSDRPPRAVEGGGRAHVEPDAPRCRLREPGRRGGRRAGAAPDQRAGDPRRRGRNDPQADLPMRDGHAGRPPGRRRTRLARHVAAGRRRHVRLRQHPRGVCCAVPSSE
jgi:hypothetical protein